VAEVAIAAAPLYHRLMTDVKSNVSKKFGIGVAILALAGAVGAGLTEVVKEAAKSTVRQTISRVQEKIEQVFPSALPQADKNAAFSIFVAKLDEDPDGSQTKLVRESLRRSFDATDAQHRIEVRRIRVEKADMSTTKTHFTFRVAMLPLRPPKPPPPRPPKPPPPPPAA
jgi:hypothetical protein